MCLLTCYSRDTTRRLITVAFAFALEGKGREELRERRVFTQREARRLRRFFNMKSG